MKGGDGTGFAARLPLHACEIGVGEIVWLHDYPALPGVQALKFREPFTNYENFRGFPRIPSAARAYIDDFVPGTYTGPNVKLGDYYVREIERIGTEHRQVVRYEVVGTGRIEQMPRSKFDRMVRPA